MFLRKTLIIMFVLSFLAVNGCTQTQEPKDMEQEKVIQYENGEVGLRVYEAQSWMMDEEAKTKQFSVTFINDYSKAIITVISNEKSFEEIKRELKVGAGKVSVLEETNDYLAFKSERLESIRTDIYISQKGGHIGIVTIMTPLKNYESNQNSIQAFVNNVELF